VRQVVVLNVPLQEEHILVEVEVVEVETLPMLLHQAALVSF